MASEIEVRVEKFNNLKEAGKNPFEITKFDQTHHTDEAKVLYDELEAQLLGDRPEVDVEGLEEQEARAKKKADYEERRAIMDAKPINVSVAGLRLPSCL